MEQESPATQDEIQVAHVLRQVQVHEPLYGLAPEPGGGGPASDGDPNQPTQETPVEEPAAPGDDRINMTWGIVFGGVLILFLLVTVLYLGVGSSVISSPFTTYPVK